MTARKRWVETADARHAVVTEPLHPGQTATSLCGQPVTVITPIPGRPAPECDECDRLWRGAEGIPLRPMIPAGQPAGNPPTSPAGLRPPLRTAC